MVANCKLQTSPYIPNPILKINFAKFPLHSFSQGFAFSPYICKFPKFPLQGIHMFTCARHISASSPDDPHNAFSSAAAPILPHMGPTLPGSELRPVELHLSSTVINCLTITLTILPYFKLVLITVLLFQFLLFLLFLYLWVGLVGDFCSAASQHLHTAIAAGWLSVVPLLPKLMAQRQRTSVSVPDRACHRW